MKIKINEYLYPKEIKSCWECPFCSSNEDVDGIYERFCILGVFNIHRDVSYSIEEIEEHELFLESIIHPKCKINNEI